MNQPDNPIVIKSNIGDIIILSHQFLKGKKVNLTWENINDDSFLMAQQSQRNHNIWYQIKRGELNDSSFE